MPSLQLGQMFSSLQKSFPSEHFFKITAFIALQVEKLQADLEGKHAELLTLRKALEHAESQVCQLLLLLCCCLYARHHSCSATLGLITEHLYIA